MIGESHKDVTLDCQVNATDLQAVAGRWRLTAANPDPDGDSNTPDYELRFDLDRDGAITAADIMQVAAAWGDTCQ